jgi:hypothetical protein
MRIISYIFKNLRKTASKCLIDKYYMLYWLIYLRKVLILEVVVLKLNY